LKILERSARELRGNQTVDQQKTLLDRLRQRDVQA
jgi:hypothetical protein